jgi:hypothetical protein
MLRGKGEIQTISVTKGGFDSVRGLKSSALRVFGECLMAIRGDEGRGRLRKVTVSRQQALTRKCPNGETPHASVIPQ